MTEPTRRSTIAITGPSDINDDAFETANDASWFLSFSAAMLPLAAFYYGHNKGLTVRVVNAVVKSPLGASGLLLLPLVTLSMEKSIYDTVQAAQGINPATRPTDRGGFPSGGAEFLPSFSLIPVQYKHQPSSSAVASTTASYSSVLTNGADNTTNFAANNNTGETAALLKRLTAVTKPMATTSATAQ